MAVFFYEVLHDLAKACQVADTALQAALEKLDDLGEEDFKEAKQIIDLLKENLHTWKEEEANGNKSMEYAK